MKTTLRQLALILAATTLTFLSTDVSAQLSIGMKGGVNLSNLSVKSSSENVYKSRTAPNFAMLFQYQLAPAFVLQAEPGFSMRGAKLDSRLASFEVGGVKYGLQATGYVKSSYIELPLVAQYRPRLTDKLRAVVSLGPEFRLLAGSMKSSFTSTVYENGQPTKVQTENRNLSGNDGIRSFDYSVATGAGLSYALGHLNVFAEGRYHWGLRSIAKKTNENQSEIFNRGTSITLGVILPIKEN